MMNKLHVTIVGKGPPLVLLHGWGWHSGIFFPLVPYLAEKFQLFLIDLPGFGNSSLSLENYTFENVASLLFEHVPSKASWLGWSLGGLIAWWIAIHYPEKVTQLITVASTPKFTAAPEWPGVAEHTLEKFSHNLTQNYRGTLEDFLALQLRGSHQPNLIRELQDQIILTPPSALPALQKSLSLLQESDLRGELNNIIVPSIHFFGSIDTLVPVKIVNHLQEKMPAERCIIIKRAGHLLFLSHREEFLSYVLGLG